MRRLLRKLRRAVVPALLLLYLVLRLAGCDGAAQWVRYAVEAGAGAPAPVFASLPPAPRVR